MQPKAEESMSLSVEKTVRYWEREKRVVGTACLFALVSIIKITKIIAKQLNLSFIRAIPNNPST